MTADLEALVVAAYVFADEYPVPARPGCPAKVSDAELVALLEDEHGGHDHEARSVVKNAGRTASRPVSRRAWPLPFCCHFPVPAVERGGKATTVSPMAARMRRSRGVAQPG